MTEKVEIKALTGLRGTAALWVLAYHARNLGRELADPAYDSFRWLAGAGYLGVDVFFVLSGFVLAYCYADQAVHRSAGAYGGFLLKRLARIYPVHLFCLALMSVGLLAMIAVGIDFHRPRLISIEGLLSSVFLVHAWSLPISATWNTVSWSISSEWAAYLVFPAVALATARLRRPLHAFGLIGLLWLLLWMVVEMRPWPNGMAYGMPRIAMGFVAGVVVFRAWQTLGSLGWRGGGAVAGCVLAVMVIGGAWLEGIRGHLFALPFALPMACIVVLGLASSTEGRIVRILSGPVAGFLGRISYSLYMVHEMVFMFARSASIEFGWSQRPGVIWVLTVAGICTSLLLAAVIYRRVEVPCRRWMVVRWNHEAASQGVRPSEALRSIQDSTRA